MDNSESRFGHERYLSDVRSPQGMEDQGQTLVVDRKVVEGYRFVDVLITGGAPWGFTLKGGMEHGELLIITKVEEGNKASDLLMAGDEIVNINDQPLSGYRQEAIALVKGSYKTLKMIVKRKNDVACRPHSWHSAKILESPMEILTPQLSKSSGGSAWNPNYHSSSSSHDTWNQANLQRNSAHFSSMGSMDSIDQTYQFGRLSSAKSNSIDQLGNQSKRDSAYGSFSTSFISHDQALSKSGYTSPENLAYKPEWDTTNKVYGKTGALMNEARGYEDKQGYQSPSNLYEYNKTQRTDDLADSRRSSRSNFGPVWHVPDTKKVSSSPPPPLPPLRSDSYAAAKTHERPSAHTQAEITSTQHFTVLNRAHQRPERNSEIADYQQRLVKVTDKTLADMRRISNSSYNTENMDQSASYDKYKNNAPSSSRLQSLSTNDVRFAQPAYNYHQRQHSDESTFFPNKRPLASHKLQQQQMSYITGARDLVSDPARVYDLHHVRASGSSVSNIEGKPNVHCNGQNRLNNTSTNQPPQGTTMQHHYKESSSRPEASTARLSSLHENAATYTQVTSHCLPQQIRDPSPEYCETLTLTEEGEGHLNYYENLSQRKNSEYLQDQCNNHSFAHNDFNDNALSSKRRSHQRDCSLVEDESVKISPQVTPMLHSLTQEGRNRSDTFPEIEHEKSPFSDAGKQSRRSDRFATTLRNEIQQRRARLQKSKSTAALMDSSDADNSECWTQDSMESTTRSSDGCFSSTYKSHLKEAQARVLKATSFQRRDLEPGLADYPSVSPERRTLGSNVSLSPFSPDVSPPSVHNVPTKQNMAATSSQNISRIGGRKRFTAQQKLRSYSEPEKMNEVGIYEESHPQNSSVSKVGVGSFADRWKFFEETSKSTQPMYTSKLAAPSQEEEKNRIHHVKDRERDPPEIWYDKKSRAVSVGHENIMDRNRAHRDCDQTHVMYKSTDDLATEQPQRLGTFAEYEASWKEQKKPLERKNSNRCHSADNILDASHEQSPKPQYIHERSRSSPTTDFYAQGAIVNAKEKSADSAREASEISSVTQCSSSTADFSLRITEGENRRDPSQLRKNSAYNNNWKTSDKSPEKVETEDVPRGSRARSGTLPNDYIFVNENVKQGSSYSALPILEAHSEPRNLSNAGDDNHWQDKAPVNKRRGPAPQRPPPPKLDKYLRQNESTSSLTASSESLVSAQSKGLSLSYNPLEFSKGQQTPDQTPVATDDHLSVLLHKPRYSGTTQNENLPLENKHIDSQPPVSTKSSYLQIPGMEPSRSPSPQFAPQKLTDKPPLLVQDANKSRIERVIDNTKVKMVPIKIVHSESHEEKESRNNLLSAVEPPALPTGLAKDQLRTLNTSEQSYSRFCAYTRHDPDTEDRFRVNDQLAHEPVENLKANSPSSHHTSNFKIKVIDADLKSEELMREIVGKDKSLADILDPNTKMKTTMDLMEGIFQKDEHLLEEAQQRRKLHPKVPSPRPADEKKDEQNVTSAISLTTSSAYYSTSAPKAELLIKMKDMQEQQNTESSEDEMDHNLYEKKQELIDSISKKLQVLREAKETLLEDIQSNNALGEEVEVIVKEVCKPNEFDKFRMFIGDLEKIVNLLLSLSGRLARVENALNNLDETASPEERRTLVDKQKLLTTQHEDAKELKENLDRRERIVFDILANYLNEENLADYEHFVKMKSALILEQRELEDKIKLGEEQLKCLTDSLPPDRIK